MNALTLIDNVVAPIQILESDDSGYHCAKFLVTTVDESNRNGRTYPRELAERETQTHFAGRVLGQSRHPKSDPDPLDHFLVFQEAMLEGDHEYFLARVVPTSKGKDFIELAKAGAVFSVSRRGTGTLKEGKDKHGKKTMLVMPESYVLQGIDVLYPDTQSDPNGRMIQFEAIDLQAQNETMEITLEQLREENADLVAKIEQAATKPLDEKIATLESDTKVKDETIATLTAEKDAAVTLAQENATKVAESENSLKELNEKLAAITAEMETLKTTADESAKQVADLNEQVKNFQEAETARNHLLEKVKGEPAAWLILDELKNERSVADVDAKFADAKTRCDALIENSIRAGKAQYLANENSELPEKKPAQNAATLEKSKRIAQFRGA